MSKKQSKEQETANQIPATPAPQKQTLVVGIGASAGGVEALTEFFEQVTADSGLAYVVILHLSPDYDSQLTEVLSQVASIPVTRVTEKVLIQPDNVYVVPPNQHLQMLNDHITVSPNILVEERRAPVDIFFRSLAESHGPMSVGVILSGTGANGSMGLKRIKENGGAVFVQNPREAVFNEMPRQAIATNLVDDILSVNQIPAKLVSYRDSLGKVSIGEEADMRPEDQQQALREIFTHLRLRTGHDFSNYKRPTLMRRFERRINVRNLVDLPSYAAFLHDHPEETQALLKDLLISVTNFFRDNKPFLALEQEILPILARDQGADGVVRIWVAGCATGEEAYSLAMLMAELTMDMIDAPKVQIFATDIDEAAITIAREGRYTLNDAADISPERLRRFLVPDGDEFKIRQEIREMVLFAHHNVLKDPPFSRIDLITCRNLLIYFNSVAQERVMETFHFALKPGGYLLLGLSETTDGAGDLFASVSRENHIYQSRPVLVRAYPVPESTISIPSGRKLAQDTPMPKDSRSLPSRLNFGDLHQQLLEQYAPPSIIVNEDYDILHLSERAGMYLHIAGGEPSKNLLKLIRPELRIELRTAFYQAVQQKSNVQAPNLQVRIDDRIETLTLHVRPVLDDESSGRSNPAQGFLLVIFETTGQHTGPTTSVLASKEPVARQLEEELVRIKAQLRTSNEQHETQAEELKASNEELQAMNEELRSAAEELETSKEELQSINEELSTVNQELKVKVEEISMTRSNLQNLINSTDLATLFLDRSLRVNLFTPAARNIFNLIPSDSGRPLTDITNRLADAELVRDAEAVLEKLQPVEREVETVDGQLFLMRVLPYRTAEDRINGVVLTFVDISRRRAAEEAVRQSEERMRLVFESARDYAILTLDLEGRVASWSPGAQMVMGYPEDKILGRPGDILFTPQDRQNRVPEFEQQTARELGYAENERWHVRKDGTRFWGSGSISPLKDGHGKLLGYVKIMRDLTERRAAEEAQSFLAAIVESSQDAIMTVNFEGVITSWNQAAHDLYGYPASDAIGQPLTMLTLPEDLDQLLKDTEKIKVYQKVEIFDSVRVNKDGREMILEVIMSPVKDTSGQVIGISTIARDVTIRKQAEDAQAFKNLTLQQQTELLALTGSWEYDRATSEFIWSEGMYQLFNLPLGHPVHTDIYLDFTVNADKEAAQQFTNWLTGGTEAIEQVLRINTENTVKYLKIRGLALPDESGALVKALGIDWDITEQVLAQEQIRQSEAQLRTLVENTPDVITRWDADLRLLFANSAFIGKSGQSLEDLLGRTNKQMGQPDHIAGPYMDKLRQTFDTGKSQEHYHSLPMPSGQFDYYSRMVPERGPDGSVQSVLAIARDITELQRAQQQTRQMAENLQAVLDASPACIGLLKAVRAQEDSGTVTGFHLAVGNQKLAEFFDEPLGELLGKPAQHFETLLWGHQTLEFLMQVYHNDNPRYDEKHIIVDGQERWLAVAISRQDDGVVLTGLDITGLKEAQSQQQYWLGQLEDARQSTQTVAQLRDALKERGELLRSASHDLRGQVGVITSAAQLLGMSGSETDNNVLIQMIQRNTRQMTQLMSSLLDFARLEAAQEVVYISTFDVAVLLRELAQNTQPFATERGLWLKTEELASLEVKSDPVQIRRIAQNLLLNALKYTTVGGVTITCERLTNLPGWCFRVTDTGPGLPARLLSRLKGEPQQEEEDEILVATGRSGGEGIGLAIVTRLCTLLGGELIVDSRPGEGTWFEIRFNEPQANE
ncbi:PAS domain S-box protein [Dyadobacter chenwenxiniae]|uniref:histidine kinase n=1 Tax=Dyadobacter chenwenxiniae TaxID=2906456 RepID=A0A9X1PNK1_9BACT|nr:PAS domain S-box protein [Dyadobacter chenwenxiniae]MCF0062838.1 PAS domain S-box protein [Dyadobacter chenwenxiniae]UON84987.1 PAS domain S-box protein [Dyadobacter chenwenxiniae]